MIKRNLWKAITSSLVTLSPILFGVIFWDALPDTIGTHFGPDGMADGTSGKLFAVLFMPLILFAFNWVCMIITDICDRKNAQSDKVYSMLFFMFPLLSMLTSGIVYAVALGFELSIGVFVCILFGVMFVVFGNYMPKVTRNRMIGIKIKWTLDNDKNWAATHRFTGKVYFFGGFAVMLAALLPMNIQLAVVLPAVLVLACSPLLYSYVYYRGQLTRGEISRESSPNTLNKKSDKLASTVSVAIGALILVFVAILMLTGDVTAVAGEEALTVDSTYYDKIVLDYDIIDSVEYREDFSMGMRSYGYASARLSLGVFQNEELGHYTLYSYVSAKAHIIVKSGDKTLAIGLETVEETKALYDTITEKVAP